MLKRIRHIFQVWLKKPLIVFLLLLGAVLYTIFHRTPQEFLEESFPITAFLAIISYGFFVMRWSIFGLPKVSIHLFLLPILYLPITIIVTTVVYYGVWVGFQDSYIWLQHQAPPRAFYVTLVGVMVVAVGYALFLFRMHARFFFGLSEALVGVLIALRNVPAKADPAFWGSDIFVVMLTASVFLIVRGFDNMHTGLKKKTRDAILKEVDASKYGSLLRKIRDGHKES